MNELSKRVLVAAVGIPLALLLIWNGNLTFLLAVIIISSLILWELYDLSRHKNIFPFKIAGLFFAAALQALFYIMLKTPNSIIGIFEFIAIILIFTMLIMILQLFSGREGAMLNITFTIGGLVYVAFSTMSLIALREFKDVIELFDRFNIFRDVPGSSLSSISYSSWGFFVIGIFAAIWICDTAAYFAGKALGKHKLSPRISPKKSWEGSIAGLIFGSASFITFIAIFIPSFPLIHSIALGIAISVIGQIGDLAESQLKRDAGVKDSSGLIPGHGGFLDRFDSMLFVMPSVFIYLCVVLLISN